jgi:hypothetical protein
MTNWLPIGGIHILQTYLVLRKIFENMAAESGSLPVPQKVGEFICMILKGSEPGTIFSLTIQSIWRVVLLAPVSASASRFQIKVLVQ